MSRYNLRILFGLSLLQNMLLSSKFRIIDNFIYPNGRKLNITLPLLFVVETIETTSKISIFMNYFFSIYFSVGIFAIFGFNVLHGHDNVLLILTVQTIHSNINVDQRRKMQLILWNWIYSVCTVFIGIMQSACFSAVFRSTKFVDIGVDYLLISVDLNLIYAIRIIMLLKMYLCKFGDNLLTDGL